MLKRILKLLVLAPLLMAFQCEDDDIVQDRLLYNRFDVNVSEASTFAVDDIIWIRGRVSTKAFNTEINDSVVAPRSLGDTFSIYKFIEPTTIANCKDAIDQFELIFEQGSYDFLPFCENAQLTVIPELDSDDGLYRYEIGLKATIAGDYVISWQNATLKNAERNEFIVDNYPIASHPNQLGFDRCGSVSWRLLDESEKEFYFTVE